MTQQELVNRIAALRFYDIANMARKVKGAPLGLDINRAFRDKSLGPSKVQFARYVVEHISNDKLRAELDTGAWEDSSRAYYQERQENRGDSEAMRPAQGDAQGDDAQGDDAQGAGQPTPAQGNSGQDSQDNDDLRPRVEALEQRADATDKTFHNMQSAFGQIGDMVEAQNAKIEALSKSRALFVTVNNEGRVTTQDMGRQHKCFDTLLSLVSAGMNVWMAGPAGSGKTTAAQNVAKALELKFYFTGAVRDEFNLLGFTDAQGRTVRKPFREAWEHGGLFLWDEIDGSDPSALVAFNAALANGVCDFPDGMVPRHKNCVILAAANTWGNSATSEYIGRNKQDAASLDRFAMLHWPYDEELETATCGNPAWAKKVQTMRQRADAQGIKQVISPRASYMGAALLASGMDEGAVINIVIRKGMTDAQWRNVKL